MRIPTMPTARAPLTLVVLLTIAACGGGPEPDAYGNFEAEEVVVSAQTSGQLEEFTASEGMRLPPGALVARIDTTQLSLERDQIVAQRGAAGAREVAAAEQVRVLEVQREVARRAYERTRRLFAERAATAQQMDQAEREYRTLLAQIEAARAQHRGVTRDSAAAAAQVERVAERIAKSSIRNPSAGTVLATYVRAGEIVQPGQPLYRIANLDTLVLRAYVTGDQLAAVRLGQSARIHLGRGDGDQVALAGVVSWISPTAEFTPTPVQTRDERADLVYAVKLRVANPRGELKIGMPADVTFTTAPARP